MLYLPPPERSLDALRLLGVEAKNGLPKNWGQYENLLRSRLNRLAKDREARSGLVNYLVNESLLEEDPGDELAGWLVNSVQFLGNLLASRAHRYLNNKSPKLRNQLLKEAQKDPQYREMNAAQRLQELRDVSLWEWWDCL